MHIPDGYLSPSTCATLYALAASAWYSALKRIKALWLSRTIPLISVFAAFSFVVMMFNVPLPGGTSGHAVGVAVAAIVLGPWGSTVAVSIALAIQALFFGDGGITTLGANCFNMAVVGSFVACWSYRAISGSSAENSRRRVVAAAVAGYLAINAAAFVTAVEFGIQPTLFHDANGAPLYAPYPLHIAIPAMMIGHLTLAGLAEGFITGGMVSYLQKAHPKLLQGVAVPAAETGAAPIPQTPEALRKLWLTVALLMMATPLGILAAGTAWGEWSTVELAQHPALAYGVPLGLRRLSSIWTAPFPAYAPAFIKSQFFGYLLSAMFGVGLLLSASLVSAALARRRKTGGS